jgi:thiol-disulfide isomerase/thioredoxin
MNKRILLALVTASLLACNALLPRTPTPTLESTVIPPTDSVTPSPESTARPTASSIPPSDIPPTAVTGMTIVRLHPEDGDLQTLLAQEAQKASALGQMPVVEFEATWCPACKAIEKGLKSKNKQLLKAFAGTYIIKLDVDEWGWGDSDLHDFDFDGIPVYFKLDAQGHPTGEVIDGNAWGDNIPENIAPPMDEFFHGE